MKTIYFLIVFDCFDRTFGFFCFILWDFSGKIKKHAPEDRVSMRVFLHLELGQRQIHFSQMCFDLH